MFIYIEFCVFFKININFGTFSCFVMVLFFHSTICFEIYSCLGIIYYLSMPNDFLGQCIFFITVHWTLTWVYYIVFNHFPTLNIFGCFVLFYFLYLFFLEFIWVTLVNKTIQISSVRLCNTPSAYCIMRSPLTVKSLSVTTIYLPFVLLPLCPTPFSSGNRHIVVCGCYLFLFLKCMNI